MTEPLGLVVLAAGEQPLPRLGASIRAFNADALPVRVVRADLESAPVLDLWRTVPYDVCVVVAPTVEFIRPFGHADFVRADGVPFAVVSEEAERRVEGAADLAAADAARDAARRELGIADRRRFVARGVSVVAADALRSFHDDVLVPRGWSYDDALARCSDEIAWYHAWLQAGGIIPFAQREHLVVALDTPGRRSDYRLNGVTAVDIARGYLGVQWPPDEAAVRRAEHGAGATSALAAGMTAGQLASASIRRVTRKAPRVQRWLRLR